MNKTLLALILLFLISSGCVCNLEEMVKDSLREDFYRINDTRSPENNTVPSNNTIPVGKLDKRAPPPLPED